MFSKELVEVCQEADARQKLLISHQNLVSMFLPQESTQLINAYAAVYCEGISGNCKVQNVLCKPYTGKNRRNYT